MSVVAIRGRREEEGGGGGNKREEVEDGSRRSATFFPSEKRMNRIINLVNLLRLG